MLVFSTLKANVVLEARAGLPATPIVTSLVPLNEGNYRPTILMPILKGCFAHEALPHPFNIGIFKWSKNNSTTIKHIYNEAANSTLSM